MLKGKWLKTWTFGEVCFPRSGIGKHMGSGKKPLFEIGRLSGKVALRARFATLAPAM
jgi:hypothetical protein